jgi:hypothetical protein
MRVGGGECSVNLRSAACFEVFEYDAQTNVLSCASCNPSGQRPLGRSNLSLLYPGTHSPAFRQPQNLSPLGNGRLFFESQDVLAPQDVNGAVQDVYEWEPAGVGGCKKQDGCVALISSGGSANDSMFMDASATGNDAFLITRQQLVGGDGDQQLDLYDARVNGGFEEAGESTCAGEACKGPLSEAPAQPSIASQSFTGPGNPTPPTTTTPPKASKPLTAKKKTHRKKKSTKGKKGRRARAGRHKRHANTTRRGGRR